MARKFKKRPELHSCIIPGFGILPDGKILEGDEYEQYHPGLLVEVTGEEAKAKVVEPPKPAPKPVPAPPKLPPVPAPAPKPAPAPAPEPVVEVKADMEIKSEVAPDEEAKPDPEPKVESRFGNKKKGTKARGKK